jgi:6-phosphogluconolactonase
MKAIKGGMKATEASMAHPAVNRHDFADGAQLAKAWPGTVADALAKAIEARGRRRWRSPAARRRNGFSRRFRISRSTGSGSTITLIDERLVPDDHRAPTTGWRTNICCAQGGKARFVPLYSDAGMRIRRPVSPPRGSTGLDCRSMLLSSGWEQTGTLPRSFPQGSTLGLATDPACPHSVMAIEAPGAGEPRLTLTLPRDRGSRADRAPYRRGRKTGGPGTRRLSRVRLSEMPVRAVLRNARQPLEIYWAP